MERVDRPYISTKVLTHCPAPRSQILTLPS